MVTRTRDPSTTVDGSGVREMATVTSGGVRSTNAATSNGSSARSETFPARSRASTARTWRPGATPASERLPCHVAT